MYDLLHYVTRARQSTNLRVDKGKYTMLPILTLLLKHLTLKNVFYILQLITLSVTKS